VSEYECVLGAGDKRYPEDEEVIVRLRNPETMETDPAKIIIRSSFEEYPEADKMYYLLGTIGRAKDPVPIEIIEIIAEEAEEVKALPRQKLTLGQRRGKMLFDMIKERKEKK